MIRNGMTYDDLEDMATEQKQTIDEIIKIEREIRHGWAFDEEPYGKLGTFRRDVADRIRGALTANCQVEET
jgi:hypothetical protein